MSDLSADVLVTHPNLELSPYAGPYASVAVAVASGSATVTAAALEAPGDEYSYSLGGTAIFGFNVSNHDTAGLSIAVLAGDPNDCGPNRKSSCFAGFDLNQTVASFGTFDVVLNWFGGFATAVPTLTFNVSRTARFLGGTDLMQHNAQGYAYVTHIFVAQEGSSTALVTGFAASAPEPGSLMTVLSGVVVLAAASIYRGRRTGGNQAPDNRPITSAPDFPGAQPFTHRSLSRRRRGFRMLLTGKRHSIQNRKEPNLPMGS